MRKLAGVLGTGPATLYWHVRDKDELLALILDDTFGRVEVPTKGGWDERLLTLLGEVRQVLRSRPVLVRAIWSAGWDLGPETLRVADALAGLVAESGIPEDEVSDAYFTLIVFVYGFVSAEALSPGNRSYGEEQSAHSLDGEEEVPDAESYGNLLRYGPGTGPEDMDRRFFYGASRLVGGVRSRVTAHQEDTV